MAAPEDGKDFRSCIRGWLYAPGLWVLNFWTFLTGELVIMVIPGPNSLYVLRTGICRGTGAAYNWISLQSSRGGTTRYI